MYTGEDTAPVLLNITYSLSEDQEAVEVQKTFRKDTTVGEMKVKRSNASRQIIFFSEQVICQFRGNFGRTQSLSGRAILFL